MGVAVHLTDIDFTSRCALQDCYVIPAGGGASPPVAADVAEADALPQGRLASPYLLQRHNVQNRLQPLALLWRCGACGKEECVAREALAPPAAHNQNDSSSNRRRSHSRGSSASSPRRHNPAVCPDCYCCPRCNATAVGISLTRQLKYVAQCSYCHWQHGAACEELKDLIVALASSTPQQLMAPYHRAVSEWQRSTKEKIKAEEEASLSLSRLAIAAHASSISESTAESGPQLHPAIALEQLRDFIRKQREKASCASPELSFHITRGEEAAANQIVHSEPATATATSATDAEEMHGVPVLQYNSDLLKKTTQMEQHGFFLPMGHPFWNSMASSCNSGSSQSEEAAATAPYLLKQNTRLPLLAMLLTSSSGTETSSGSGSRNHSSSDGGGDSSLCVVNGVERDPSFDRVAQDLRTRSGGERRRRPLLHMPLAAVRYLPVLLQQRGRCDAPDGSERYFTLHNFGDEQLVVRRFTIACEVGGTFTSSLIIPEGAGADAFVTIPPRSSSGSGSAGVEFGVTLHRHGSGSSCGDAGDVMVGFIVEVLTMLPVWRRTNSAAAATRSGIASPQPFYEDAEEETATGSLARCQHIVAYGLTIAW
ncbi:hypothetical protein DQ04_03671010 [Trypanosoma grayi]|uniref:hypothetical protein n=1 Tax=Trypanosoma grayi TaxID=71804 RepID=UPI0004F44633|nr:hypothetical protein DQ04_03671010 [Trypanosoma grayi]KEG10474.1 hypothetical protein DQ04_03671010 [Trypanosoma grayi]